MVRSMAALGALGLLLGLGACMSLARIEPPEVSVAGLALTEPGLFEQRVRVDLRLRNPNDVDLGVERVVFQLEVNDADFGKGWTTEPFELPAYGEAVVPVTIVVPTNALIERFMELGTEQRLAYRLEGRADLDGLAPVASVPFEREGSFALPVPHEAKPPGAKPTGS